MQISNHYSRGVFLNSQGQRVDPLSRQKHINDVNGLAHPISKNEKTQI